MNVIHIWPEEPRREGNALHVSASIEIPGRERLALWYLVPECQQPQLSTTADHFVLGTVFLLMQGQSDVRVHGQVAPSLLRNLQEFQAAWCAIVPGFSCVSITADREEEPGLATRPKRAVMAFSGGVDSCFTAFRHARAVGTRFPSNLVAGVMVHGFDIPLADKETFASAAARSTRILSSLGLDLFTVATNYRTIVADWDHSHAAAIASCLSLLSRDCTEGLIGQTFTYRELRTVTEGVNALTDPLLSSDCFRIVPDGAAFKRSDKILAMRGWSEFLCDLRVCWEGPQKDRNCCNCEKCMRNILTFRVLGLGLPPCFERDIDDQQVRTLRLGDQARADIRYGGVVRLAAERGVTGSWLRILEERLAAQKRAARPRIVRGLWRLRSYASRAWARVLPGRA
jgi:hypothetical protein